MAYAQKLPSYISPEDCLLREERATTKHDYLDDDANAAAPISLEALGFRLRAADAFEGV